MPIAPCLYFEPSAYSIDLKKLMGRNAAGASFVKGFLEHSVEAERIFLYVSNIEDSEPFKSLFSSYNREERVELISKNNFRNLNQTSSFYYPGPNISLQAHSRSLFDPAGWSVCGITHTTSSSGAMDAIASWITSPVESWDAVICTSQAVKKNVETLLQAEVDRLNERLGLTKIVLPQLPIIPLGINTAEFEYSNTQRERARKTLGADENSLIVLYMGRLSFHAKAHPLAMYQSLEEASRISGKEILLVECGWYGNEYIEEAFKSGADLASPSIRVIHLDGRIAENREIAWAGADIFCSLSDNIQETFGIVPIEAMAAGLPVVVSDWDGYKDTVREGIDGFRIPTIAPAPGLAGDLSERHALEIDTYDMYCGYSSSLVAVHTQKLTQAFTELFNSPQLRKQMGEAARKRAEQTYDWRTIIPLYEELWSEQDKIRKSSIKNRGESAKKQVNKTAGWPSRLDPTVGFSNYPTGHLTLDTDLTLTEPTAELALAKVKQYKELAMVNYASYIFPTDKEIQMVFEIAESNLPNSCSAKRLIQNIDKGRRPYVLRGLAWLCKLGLLQFS